jgi:hypothetical protein
MSLRPPSARTRRRGVLAAVVLGAVVALAVVTGILADREPGGTSGGPTDGTSAPPPGVVPDGRLTWPPPTLADPVHVTIDGPGTVRLDDDTDYVVEAPDTIVGPVVLRGGRNVVWIGGHIRIDAGAPGTPVSARRGLVVKDGEESQPDRVVHLEGLLIDGAHLTEGIDVNAPSAVVQIENTRIEGVHFESADDLEGKGSYRAPNHPDIVQTWGSVAELRIDGLTGTSAYQGLFLKADRNRPHGPVWLRRVDLHAVTHESPDGTLFHGQRLLWWSRQGTGPMRVDNGTVWVEHDPRSEWGTSLGENVHYPASAGGADAAVEGRDSRGPFISWPSAELADGRPAVRNFPGTGPGQVYGGRPATGEYVPEGVAGTGYRSPGYLELEPPSLLEGQGQR